MLIAAASFAVALAVSAAGVPALAPVPPIPQMTIKVSAAPDIPARLVTAVLAEADAVWCTTGVSFLWRREDQPATMSGRVRPERRYESSALRVVIGHETQTARDQRYALGWIVFDDSRTPEQEIYVSYTNVVMLLEHSAGIVGVVQSMPILQRETLLARAMGRALAHELGHYLSASKVHTPKGLMKAVHTAGEFFGRARDRFMLEPAERQQIVGRLTSMLGRNLTAG